MNRIASSRLALLLCLSVLSGCATYRSATVVQDGPGLSFKPDEITVFRQNQDLVLEELYALAAVDKADGKSTVVGGNWDAVIDAGMDYADVRCEAYIHALFRLNRDKKSVTNQLGLLGGASAGLMAAVDAAARNVAAVAIGFGLASATVDNLASNLLYELDPSSVRTLVKSLQSHYRAAKGKGYGSRPVAMSVMRGYAALCVPANIEAEVNVAVKSSSPMSTPGNPSTGEAPVVSNAESAITAVKFDDNTAKLRSFVFPNGTLNADNRAKLEAFLKKKEQLIDVSSFMRLERFAALRAEAVAALGL